jgi:hypothetical protein
MTARAGAEHSGQEPEPVSGPSPIESVRHEELRQASALHLGPGPGLLVNDSGGDEYAGVGMWSSAAVSTPG